MLDGLFSVKQAADITQVSRQSIRGYTTTYARWFSTEATPERGSERRFTRADLKLIKFIFSTVTQDKLTHEQVQERLAAGVLDSFEWEPQDAPGTMSDPTQDGGTSLVPMERLQAAHALMMDAQRREEAALQREQALQERIEQMQREMGKLEGELTAIKTRPRSWWARVFGGGEYL